MAGSIEAHLLGPVPERGIVELTGMGLADNGTEVVADRQRFALRQRLDVELEVLRQQLANDDGTPGQMSRQHALAQVR